MDGWMDADGEVVTPKSIVVGGVVLVNGDFANSDVESAISRSIERQSNWNFAGVSVVSIVG